MLLERPSGGMVALLQGKERNHEGDFIIDYARIEEERGALTVT
jgi:hypothetical protein